MIYVFALLITVLMIGFFFLTLVGLPGTWGMVICAVLLAWLAPVDAFVSVSWWTVAVLVGLALLGELVEFIAGAARVGQLGGSRRAASYAILGSIAGAVVGLFAGGIIPIPVIGSLIGSVLLGGVGAATGAFVAERSLGRDTTRSAKIGMGAFWGRIFGTVGKTVCAAIMAVVLVVYCWW